MFITQGIKEEVFRISKESLSLWHVNIQVTFWPNFVEICQINKPINWLESKGTPSKINPEFSAIYVLQALIILCQRGFQHGNAAN